MKKFIILLFIAFLFLLAKSQQVETDDAVGDEPTDDDDSVTSIDYEDICCIQDLEDYFNTNSFDDYKSFLVCAVQDSNIDQCGGNVTQQCVDNCASNMDQQSFTTYVQCLSTNSCPFLYWQSFEENEICCELQQYACIFDETCYLDNVKFTQCLYYNSICQDGEQRAQCLSACVDEAAGSLHNIYTDCLSTCITEDALISYGYDGEYECCGQEGKTCYDDLECRNELIKIDICWYWGFAEDQESFPYNDLCSEEESQNSNYQALKTCRESCPMMLEDLSSENLPYGPWTDQLDLDESDGEENFDIKLVSLGLISLILITISLI